jgi:hypothetical protein
MPEIAGERPVRRCQLSRRCQGGDARPERVVLLANPRFQLGYGQMLAELQLRQAAVELR